MTRPPAKPPARKDLDWTSAEDATLRTEYRRLGAKGVAATLDRHSVHAIRKRAERLNIVRLPSKGHALSAIEIIDALRNHRGSVHRAAATLDVAPTSLRRRAEQLGIPCTDRKPHWTGAELARLRSAMIAGSAIDPVEFPGRTAESVGRQMRRLRQQLKSNGT